MRLLRLALLPVVIAAAGCAGSREAGVVTLSAVDPYGRNPGSFNFAFVDRDSGKVAWSETPSEGATAKSKVQGGAYWVLVVSGSGAATLKVDVDGDEMVTAHLTSGGAARGEARLSGKPFSAEIWMPIPGKGNQKSSALSYITRANADGRFQIDRLPPGKWVLVVGTAAEGFKEVTVDIVDGKVAELGYVEVR